MSWENIPRNHPIISTPTIVSVLKLTEDWFSKKKNNNKKKVRSAGREEKKKREKKKKNKKKNSREMDGEERERNRCQNRISPPPPHLTPFLQNIF